MLRVIIEFDIGANCNEFVTFLNFLWAKINENVIPSRMRILWTTNINLWIEVSLIVLFCQCSTFCFVCCCLLAFHEHPTGLDVVGWSTSRPDGVAVVVEPGRRAAVVPPSTTVVHWGTGAATKVIVVTVYSAELTTVGICTSLCRLHHRVAGVSAVSIHRQPIVSGLITDGERRVFSPVPLAASTLDLHVT